MLESLSQLVDLVGKQPPKTVVLSNAQDAYALQALLEAQQQGLVKAVLVGNQDQIESLAAENTLSLVGVPIYHQLNTEKATQQAIELIGLGEAAVLMKGKQHTSELLKAVLRKENKLRTQEQLSHFALFEIPSYHKLLALSDVAINVLPDFDTKVSIIKNAVNFMNRLGYRKPKVGLISAIEQANAAVLSSVEAEKIKELAIERHYTKALIDGPLSFDIATSSKIAAYKGYHSEVAGDADLLIFPNIETGNVLYKSLRLFAQAESASVVLGAKVPIVLVSRGDSKASKLNSILLACSV